MQLMRDFDVYPAAHSAFLLNLGLESDRNYALARKYLKGCSGVILFVLKGGNIPNVSAGT